MDNTAIETGTYLITQGAEVLERLPARKRSMIDDVEIVFVDVINGKKKHSRGYCFIDVLEKISDGSKPIGLLLLRWDQPDKMDAKAFPGTTTEEQELLHHALAEAQDQAKENLADDD